MLSLLVLPSIKNLSNPCRLSNSFFYFDLDWGSFHFRSLFYFCEKAAKQYLEGTVGCNFVILIKVFIFSQANSILVNMRA